VPFKILLADDSMTAQNMARKILSEAGHEVVTVSNGAAALKKIAETAPNLIILDIYMPGYSGFEVCERVKRASSHTPVLLSVGKLEPYREEDALAVRANGVIVKPFEATELIATVEKVMAGPSVPGEGQAEETEISASPPAAYEKYPAPSAHAAGEQTAMPVKPADAGPIPALQNMAGPAPAFPAVAAGESTFQRELPPEVSKLTEGLVGSPPSLPEEAPGHSASRDSGARLQGAEGSYHAPAKVEAVGTAFDDSSTGPFALDDLLNTVREGQPAATAVPSASRAEPAPSPLVGVPVELSLPQPPSGPLPVRFDERPADSGRELAAAKPAFSPQQGQPQSLTGAPAFDFDPGAPVIPLQEQQAPPTMPGPATNGSFSEIEFVPAEPPAAAFAGAQDQSQVEAARLEAQAGFSSKWRIAVRPPSAQPSMAGPPAIAEDFSAGLLSELETPPSPDQAVAGTSDGSAAASRQAPAPAMDSAAPLAPSTAAERPAIADGFAFSAPRMLEATAAMSFPNLSDAEQSAASASRPQAEPHEAALDSATVTAAVQRAMDHYKPLIVAEILRELSKPRGS
jgi:CheY-like chemotaxis protein